MTGHFLQSKEWEEFQRALGREAFRIGDTLVIKLPLVSSKTYLYSGGADLRFKIYDLRRTAKQHNVIFLKLEPMTGDKDFAQELLKAGFKKSAKQVQPQRTIVLGLEKNERELLDDMHKKTRYNIRLAQKKDLRFKILDLRDTPGAFEQFWEILQKTKERDVFYTHTKDYYEKLLCNFSYPHTIYHIPYTILFGVESDGELIAASIVLFYNGTAYYLHGASDYDYRSLMAPYLLHWETIKYAKKQGYKKYNFWGIDEEKWPGVTRFKKGFGGKEVQYAGSYDYVFKPVWYWAYNLRNLFKTIWLG